MKDIRSIVEFIVFMPSKAVAILAKCLDKVAGYGWNAVSNIMKFCRIPKMLIEAVLMCYLLPVSMIIFVLFLMRQVFDWIGGLMMSLLDVLMWSCWMLVAVPLFLMGSISTIKNNLIRALSFVRAFIRDIADTVVLVLFSIYHLSTDPPETYHKLTRGVLMTPITIMCFLVTIFGNLPLLFMVCAKGMMMLDFLFETNQYIRNQHGENIANFIGFFSYLILLCMVVGSLLMVASTGAFAIGWVLFDVIPTVYLFVYSHLMVNSTCAVSNDSGEKVIYYSALITFGYTSLKLCSLIVGLYIPIGSIVKLGLDLFERLMFASIMIAIFTKPIHKLYSGPHKENLPKLPSFLSSSAPPTYSEVCLNTSSDTGQRLPGLTNGS